MNTAITAYQTGNTVTLEQITEVIFSQLDVMLVALIACALTLLVLWLVLHREWKASQFWSASRFLKAPIGICALLGLFLNLFTDGAVYFSQITKIFPEYEALMSSLIGRHLFLELLGVALLAPVVEEIIFRGVILRRLLRRSALPPAAAVVLQALLFSLIHGNVVQGLYAFVLGIVLGLLYVWFESIWAVVAVHVFYNLFSVVMSNSPLAGVEIPDAVLAGMTAAALLISAGLLVWLAKKRRKELSV
ncbi:MAG: CPBP family intramembrane metalloprotease [Clostridiales bacterium]|nr:CPBP family intramembrane metalloprotease [Clostridiales bacterium]